MTRDKITEINAATGETIEREMTVAEQKQRDILVEEIKAAEAAKQAEAEAKAQAKAQLLAQLGITEEQAKLLLS